MNQQEPRLNLGLLLSAVHLHAHEFFVAMVLLELNLIKNCWPAGLPELERA